ncbi:MAG TPA: MOFRL family protein, partial [Thermomicrobiales bacterium]|nr:MOFRL family protein [Thermomicrobiales bacterium]
EPRPGAALEVLERYGLREKSPGAVVDALYAARPDPAVVTGAHDMFAIVGDNDVFISRMRAAAEADGFLPEIVLPGAEGEARELASHFLDLADGVTGAIDVVIGGGEATVTVKGSGEGGRNTEFALAAAMRLADTMPGWVVASLASDGQDGTLDAAGAIVDEETLARGHAAGLDAASALADNDSGTYLARTGDLVSPGPTGTNVNDVYLAVRCR